MNNIHNKLVTEQQLYDFINYYTNLYDPNLTVRINDIGRMRKNLVHKSYCIVNNDNIDSDNYCCINFNSYLKSSNERLEFLGDSVLDLIIVEYLFDTFPDKDEGFLTKLKIKLVNKKTLCYLGREIGLSDMILLSSMMERTGARTSNVSLIEDVFESFIGGLYKDQKSNIYVCKAFILGIIKKHINIQEYIDTESDFKSIVMKEFHKKFSCNPTYFLSKIEGDIKSKQFNVIVCVEKSKIPEDNLHIKILQEETLKIIESYGGNYSDIDLNKYAMLVTNLEPKKSKKEAEQECCRYYLENINNLI